MGDSIPIVAHGPFCQTLPLLPVSAVVLVTDVVKILRKDTSLFLLRLHHSLFCLPYKRIPSIVFIYTLKLQPQHDETILKRGLE